MSQPFGDRLILAVRRLGHPLCVGLDPHLERIPEAFRPGGKPLTTTDGTRAEASAEAIERFVLAILDRIAGRVAAVKPQIACYEQLGWRGLRCLERVVDAARQRGLLVVLDAKRNDIGSTSACYARAYLGADAALPADAMTLTPYLGVDSLQPFLDQAADADAGLFVLVKTSNPGSGDFQDQAVDGRPLYQLVAEAFAEHASRLRGPETGWSSLGVVVGATYPGQAETVRQLLPHSLFLVPGYGAQGAGAADAVRGFVRHQGRLEGGLVNSARGILFPAGSELLSGTTWERAIDGAIDRAVTELSAATS